MGWAERLNPRSDWNQRRVRDAWRLKYKDQIFPQGGREETDWQRPEENPKSWSMRGFLKNLKDFFRNVRNDWKRRRVQSSAWL